MNFLSKCQAHSRFSRGLLLAATLLFLSSCGVLSRQSPDYFAGPLQSPTYQPKGHLEEVIYPCSVPGPSTRRLVVYLPENYYQSDERYPVVYLLHGARGYETTWIRRGRILQIVDSLVVHKQMSPSIIVLPNTNQYNDDIDMEYSRRKIPPEALLEIDGAVESSFLQDIVSFIDENFRTRADKGHRAIAGMSIGGLQSLYLSANFPESFDYVGLFSPVPGTLFKCGPYDDFYKNLDKKLDVLFQKHTPKVYAIMIGKADALYAWVSCFRNKLVKKKYPHQFTVYEGGHDWYNWTEFCAEFLKVCFK